MVYPIIAVIYYSFTDYDIVRPPVWIGLENFQNLFADETFWLALTHSIVYLLVTPILIVMSIALAIVVNRQLRGIHIYRALYFVPAVSGSIAIGLSWRWLFERTGFINSMLLSLGVIESPSSGWPRRPSSCRSRCCSRSGRASGTTRSSSWPGSRTSPRSSTTRP